MNPYLPRALEDTIISASRQFPVVGVTGPRQTGKSTLLRHLFPSAHYISLDDPVLRGKAKSDPSLFIGDLPEETIIDEIQYAPELLPYIKIRVDGNRRKTGMFFLTGSQVFNLMSGISESMSGRIALFELLGFSAEELPKLRNPMGLPALFEVLHTGLYPDPAVHGVDPDIFFSSYLQTYLERDIRQIRSVHDLTLFQRFLELLAARAGSLLNVTELARDCGISHTVAGQWISLLESTRILYLLRPYFRNVSKRVVKTPKPYFTDTGLLRYLLRYPTPETLRAGPMAGHIFENFIISEVLKWKFNHAINAEIYFYRDSNGNEIDCVIDLGVRQVLMEIKMRASISDGDSASLSKFPEKKRNVNGYLVSCWEHRTSIGRGIENVPWWMLGDLLGELIHRR